MGRDDRILNKHGNLYRFKALQANINKRILYKNKDIIL